ncbi:MAG: hypothetical protein O7A68_10495 [Alphaproteobacteria bacterium]|nr:hypothetical protein [Alphaproteobacteria bacterium]
MRLLPGRQGPGRQGMASGSAHYPSASATRRLGVEHLPRHQVPEITEVGTV